MNKILKKFNMAEEKGVSMPASHEESDNHKDVSGKVPYHEAVGSLVYLVAATCPDIVFAIHKAAWVTDKQAEKDWNEATCVFCCFGSTSNYGLRCTIGFGELKVFNDADFAGGKVTRRFTMGVTIIFADCPVSWIIRLQKVTTLLKTEAKIIASSEGAKELGGLK
jgi:hypothetical protein